MEPDNAASKIQRWWKKYLARKFVLTGLFENLIQNDLYINAMDPHTTQVMKFALKVLTGKENTDLWFRYFAMMCNGLLMDRYSGGPGAMYYNQIENAHVEIMNRFRAHDPIVG